MGAGRSRLRRDEFENWTPHPSPDGQSVLILSYPKGVKGHPTNTDIAFRILNVADGKIRRAGGCGGRVRKRQHAELGAGWEAFCVCEF